MQEAQEMAADRVVVGLGLDPLAVMAEVIPIQEHRAERGHQAVGDVLGAREAVVVLLGQERAEHRDAGAHHVHRVRRRRNAFEDRPEARGQAAQRFELGLVAGEFGDVRELAVDQEVRHFLELRLVGEIEDVVAAVVQVVAGAADRAKRGVAGGDAGQGDGFLRFRPGGNGGGGLAHLIVLHWSCCRISAWAYPSRLFTPSRSSCSSLSVASMRLRLNSLTSRPLTIS